MAAQLHQDPSFAAPDRMMAQSSPLLVDRDDEDQSEEIASVDCLGRPPSSGRHLGGWSGAFFILGAVTFSNIAYAGIFFNLVLYFRRVWHQDNAVAANNVTNLSGTMFCTSLLGAFLSDAYLGRFWASAVFFIVFLVGCTLSSVVVSLQVGSTALWICLCFSLFLAAIGYGSYEPALASLGGDQLDSPEAKGTFFNLFFVVSNIGPALSLVILTDLENLGKWAMGFWISTAAVGIALLVFFSGAPKIRQYRVGGNPVIRITQVLVSAFRKLSIEVPSSVKSLHELPGDKSAIRGSRKISHTNNLRWLDKAATITDDDLLEESWTSNDSWSLCTVTQVEEVKCLARIFPIWLTGICFNAAVAQLTTLFVEQGDVMNNRVGKGFTIPSASMQLFNILSNVIFAPFYDFVLVPYLRRTTGQPKGLTTLQRMGSGLVVCIVAMVIAGLVEMRRLAAANTQEVVDHQTQSANLSIFWLVPQYAIVGISQVLVVVGQMDFFYSEVSDGMKSLGSSLPLLSRAFGNYASSILVAAVTSITTRGGNPGWIPRNLNEGHVDNFYWLLTLLMVVTFLIFLICAHFYTYLDYEQDEEHCNQIS